MKKRMGLAGKTALGVVAVILVVMGQAAYLFTGRIEAALEEGLTGKAEVVAATLEPALQRARLANDLADLRRIVNDIHARGLGVEGIAVTTEDGRTLAAAGTLEGTGHLVEREITVAGRSFGRLAIRFSRAEVERAIGEAFARSVQVSVILCAIGILAAAALAKHLAAPMEALAAAAERVAGGDLTVRVPETRADEIGTVQRSFNAMVEGLARSRAALERRLAEMSALYEVARILHRSSELDEVLSLALEAAGTGFGFRRTAVFLAPEGKDLRLAASHGLSAEPAAADFAVFLAGGEREEEREGDDPAGARWVEVLPTPFSSPGVVAPLVAAGRTVGLLVAAAGEGEDLDRENAVRLAAVFGSQLAPALHAAWAGEELAARRQDPFTPLVLKIEEALASAGTFGLPVAVLRVRRKDARARAREDPAGLEDDLRRLGDYLETRFPEASLVVRYGPGAFLVAVPGASRADAEAAAASLDPPVPCEVTVAAAPEDGETAVALLASLP